MTNLGIRVHPTELGAWDLEHDLDNPITTAKFIRAKVYGVIQSNGEVTIKTAGLPIAARKQIHTLDGLYLGRVFEGAKLIPQNVPGGQILVPTNFTLTER